MKLKHSGRNSMEQRSATAACANHQTGCETEHSPAAVVFMSHMNCWAGVGHVCELRMGCAWADVQSTLTGCQLCKAAFAVVYCALRSSCEFPTSSWLCNEHHGQCRFVPVPSAGKSGSWHHGQTLLSSARLLLYREYDGPWSAFESVMSTGSMATESGFEAFAKTVI